MKIWIATNKQPNSGFIHDIVFNVTLPNYASDCTLKDKGLKCKWDVVEKNGDNLAIRYKLREPEWSMPVQLYCHEGGDCGRTCAGAIASPIGVRTR